MKPADDIKRFFRSAGLSINPKTHERVFQDMLAARQQTMRESPAQPEKWRLAMKHPITKYAVAAVLALAALAAFGLFHRTGSVSWAIEQSVEALSKYNALTAEGLTSERAWTEDGSPELRPTRIWAVANADQTAIEKYRFEFDGVALLATDGRKTWKYEPQVDRVTITDRPYVASECWLGSGLLEQLKTARDEGIITRWEEKLDKDPATRRQRIILEAGGWDRQSGGPRSVRLEFDPETKLLVSLRQWENSDWEGPADFVAEKITYYESLPDALFELQIPEGATVIEK